MLLHAEEAEGGKCEVGIGDLGVERGDDAECEEDALGSVGVLGLFGSSESCAEPGVDVGDPGAVAES